MEAVDGRPNLHHFPAQRRGDNLRETAPPPTPTPPHEGNSESEKYEVYLVVDVAAS